MDNCKESDWKLFRVKIVEWQERYMDKLNHKLAKLLLDEEQSAGVIIEMKRSMLKLNLLSLLKEKAITLEDLKVFSPELQDEIKRIWES